MDVPEEEVLFGARPMPMGEGDIPQVWNVHLPELEFSIRNSVIPSLHSIGSFATSFNAFPWHCKECTKSKPEAFHLS